MAMAFAPLGLKVPININNPEVVSKSYPAFGTIYRKLALIKISFSFFIPFSLTTPSSRDYICKAKKKSNHEIIRL